MKKIKIITCSGANEHTDQEQMIALMRAYPRLEFGIQVSDKKCNRSTDRYWWIKNLQFACEFCNLVPNLALHINPSWVEFFTLGCTIPDLDDLLSMRDINGAPFFKRIQLNFKIGRDLMPDMEGLFFNICHYGYGKNRRFIFSYNESNAAFIEDMREHGIKNFDVLFDSSHGEGVQASSWQSPLWNDNGLWGYAGGLSPDNIMAKLDQINLVVPKDQRISVDAEGKLKGDDKHLSLAKCEQFVKNVLFWEQKFNLNLLNK